MSQTLDAPGRVTAPRPPAKVLRYEVQALRALAVLMVVLFHFWPGRLPGGYVGVDVFFVISGFLITGHLLREVETTGTVALGRFWARRARRLLPAAYLVIAVSVVVTLLVVPMTQWQQWFREAIGATLYVENWVLAADSVDYLAAENAPSPVQHYWSLSAEEQFYLVWPVLVLLATLLAARGGRSRRGMTGAVLAAATLASFGWSLWLTTSNPSSAYFVTTTRAWQFGAGALLAVVLARTAVPAVSGRWRSLVSWAGLAAIAACGLVYSSRTPFPGTAAVLPVVATLAVIWAGTPSARLSPSPLMRWRPVQYTGEVSYSLYLWHWPAIVILPYMVGHTPGLVERVVLLVAVVLLSAVTKRYVEDTFRFTHRWGLQRTGRALGLTAATAAVLALVAGAGLAVADHRAQQEEELAARLVADMPPCFGAGSMDPEKPCENPDLDGMLVPAPEAVGRDFANYPDCWVDGDEDRLKECSFGPVDDPKVPHVVLIGDSHARAMLPAFIAMAQEGTISLTPQLKATCAWTTGTMNYDNPLRSSTCETWKDQLQPWLLDHADDIDLVVTTGYLKMLSGDADQQRDEMAAAWRPVAAKGVPIVGLSDNPYHPTGPSRCLEKLDVIEPDSCDTTRKKAFPFPETFAATAREVRGAKFVDLTDYYCLETTCPSVIGGVNVYRDNSHLTTTYTKTMSPYVLRELRAAGALD
ncbi:acyltransferase family protein [Isoptericola sp. NPDC057191]|uniref:acyltransferase family protein n=1 Tax=Isoptericola sp. NPDC057191 TaxID=3346041 RepID=UPI00363D1FE0